MLGRRFSFQIILGMLAVVACLIVSCAHGYTQEQTQKGILRIWPSELFTGELKRLQPHLNLTASGCVKVDYSGQELPINLELELWHNGTPKSLGYSSSSITQPSEVSISVQEVSQTEETRKYQIITAISNKSGYSSAKTLLDMPIRKKRITGPKHLSNTIDINNTKPVAVWALLENTGNLSVTSSETVEEAAKRVESAIVLKFSQGNKVVGNKNPVE